MYGTVARIRSWLLLEYPGPWRRRAVEDSRLLSAAVKRRLRSLGQEGSLDRPLLIRREHTHQGSFQCFFVQSCDNPPSIRRTVLASYEELLTESGETQPVQGLLYAVCTHGRHDKCCAKFGVPVYCAFREIVADRVWECSHVGGDRFAANIVVFPYGLYFGRVTPDEVPELVRRCEAGQIWLERFRGRSCYPRALQVAEYFVRAESGRTGIDEFSPKATSQSDTLTRVSFEARSDSSVHTVEFSRSTGPLRHLLTCQATQPEPVPQYDLIRYSTTT